MKLSRRVTIVNDLGLHLRAAGSLVQLAAKFHAKIWVSRDGQAANGKSIMSVLSLAAAKGVEIELIAEGDDAQAAIDALAELVASGFGHG